MPFADIKAYQVRGLPGQVKRFSFNNRLVDFWQPKGGTDHLIIAHDGQNIFDRKTATFLHTWKLGQKSARVAQQAGMKPPAIIAVFHSSSKANPHGRAKDLCPEDPFRDGIKPLQPPVISVDELQGNQYLLEIFDTIVPSLIEIDPKKTAMIGSSMGGLATLNAAIRFHDRFTTAIALSPHWTLAGNPLVDWMIPRLPKSEAFKIWMSRGTKGLDASYEPHQDHADALMADHGWNKPRYVSKVFQRTAHNERSWASYLEEPLRFWLT